MPNTFFGLTIATSGIYAASVNLNVTGNNAANAATEGYSRQKATQVAMPALRVYQEYGTIGTGVTVTSINRIRDSFYDKKYAENQSKLGEAKGKEYHMQQIQNSLNAYDIDGFTVEFTNFVKGLEEVQKKPADMPARMAALNSAESLMKFYQQVKTNLTLQQQDVNAEINDYVDKINILATDIAALNKQINVVEMTKSPANELRDQRDLLIDQLSEICEVQVSEKVYENGKTEYTVRLGTNTLVDNYDTVKLKVVSREERLDPDDAVGLYDIEWASGEEFNPQKKGLNGMLKGLIEIRDGNNGMKNAASPDSYEIDYKGIVYYIDEINKFQDALAKAINDIHMKGQDNNGNSTEDIPLYVKNDAGEYVVNPVLIEDPSKLATRYAKYQDGSIDDGSDNTGGIDDQALIQDMRNLQTADIVESSTCKEFLQSLVSEVAVDTQKQQTLEKNYSEFQVVIQNQRLTVMGVDKDEEGMNLLKFQKAFDLNSEVINVMQEIYDKLINGTGV